MVVAGTKSAEIGIFKSKSRENRIIEAIIKQSNQRTFSHANFMNIGLVCKDWDKFLCATAYPRKEYALTYFLIPLLRIWDSGDAKWHRYGSRADYKKIDKNPKRQYPGDSIVKKKLNFGRVELIEHGRVERYWCEGFNFDSELSYKPSPFYKSDKELCCFGLAWKWTQSFDPSCRKRLVLYIDPLPGCIINRIDDSSSTDLPLECSLRYERETEQHHESLIKLLHFPHLLKIILNTHYDYFWNGYEYGYRCDLEKIILPDNYKECVESNEEGCYKTFAELPEKLKAALEKRYKEQPK
jgi:hypothetical protein